MEIRTIYIGTVIILMTVVAACVSNTQLPPTPTSVPSTSTPIPPTSTLPPPTSTPAPTATETVLLKLTFDGERCIYDGPTTLKIGAAALLFLNESEGDAAVNLVLHTGGHTIQDMIDYIGEEPGTKHAPDWSTEKSGVWSPIGPGESHLWEGDLGPGTYTMVCANTSQFGIWFATGLKVSG